jgi:ribulose-5-phosphate 4-epimerase/fuculose-1-phosphate aldolase
VRQIDDLVAAYRVLAAHDVIDGYGHVSVRSEKNPNRYFLAGHIAPELVREEHIIEYDLDSNPQDANGRESVRERFIHGEIFKARPEVMSVVHTHSHSVVPFSITTATLKPIFHMAAFIGHGVPNWDIANAQEGTDMLVKTPFLGAHLAKFVADKPAALLRGHGAVVVGESIARSVGRSIYLELSAKMQIQAQLLAGAGGKLLTLHDAEVAASVPAQNYNRAWPMWRARALAQVAAEKTLRDFL